MGLEGFHQRAASLRTAEAEHLSSGNDRDNRTTYYFCPPLSYQSAFPSTGATETSSDRITGYNVK